VELNSTARSDASAVWWVSVRDEEAIRVISVLGARREERALYSAARDD